jgi:hypothetical protein
MRVHNARKKRAEKSQTIKRVFDRKVFKKKWRFGEKKKRKNHKY